MHLKTKYLFIVGFLLVACNNHNQAFSKKFLTNSIRVCSSESIDDYVVLKCEECNRKISDSEIKYYLGLDTLIVERASDDLITYIMKEGERLKMDLVVSRTFHLDGNEKVIYKFRQKNSKIDQDKCYYLERSYGLFLIKNGSWMTYVTIEDSQSLDLEMSLIIDNILFDKSF